MDKLFWHLTDNGEYKLMEGAFIEHRELPSMSSCDKFFLKEMNVTYRRQGERFIIYDPNVEEYENYTAPVKNIIGAGVYPRFPEEMHTGQIPTEAMFQAAHTYATNIRAKIRAERVALERANFDKFFVRMALDGFSLWRRDFDVGTCLCTPAEKMDSEKYVLVNFSNSPNEYFEGLVILKSAIKTSTITLKIPAKFVGKAIGKGGENARNLAQQLNVRYVKFVPLEN